MVMEKRSILLITRYDQRGASSRYRFLQYIPYLESEGFRCVVSPLFDDAYLANLYRLQKMKVVDLLMAFMRRLRVLFTVHRFDLVVLEKEIIPYMPALLERLLSGIPYVVDYDDAIFHQYDCHTNPIVRRVLGQKIAVVMRHAGLVVAGNNYLAEYAHRAGAKRVEIIPTVIDITRYPQPPRKKNALFTIGWIGSPTTYQHVEGIMPALAKICANGDGKLLLIGAGERNISEPWIELRPWSEASEVADMQACDVGIMPLPDIPWARGKCGFKLIQYMACGLPVIASPVGVNTEIVEPGKNGYLASNLEEWVNALTCLRNDKALGTRLGMSGRKKVETSYCLQIIAPRLVKLFRQSMPLS